MLYTREADEYLIRVFSVLPGGGIGFILSKFTTNLLHMKFHWRKMNLPVVYNEISNLEPGNLALNFYMGLYNSDTRTPNMEDIKNLVIGIYILYIKWVI